ncbi:MAG: hypothetical protein V3U76_11630 [Granulosicoccus sp.]
MSDALPDPIRAAAILVCPDAPAALELRIKRDAFNSITRIKPAMAEGVNFDTDVVHGEFFAELPAPLQGIAIARTEGVLAFYNRVGWHPDFLDSPLAVCVPESALETLEQRYHARTLHDLAYVHPKHFERMLGKTGAAELWEQLTRFVSTRDAGHD